MASINNNLPSTTSLSAQNMKENQSLTAADYEKYEKIKKAESVGNGREYDTLFNSLSAEDQTDFFIIANEKNLIKIGDSDPFLKNMIKTNMEEKNSINSLSVASVQILQSCHSQLGCYEEGGEGGKIYENTKNRIISSHPKEVQVILEKMLEHDKAEAKQAQKLGDIHLFIDELNKNGAISDKQREDYIKNIDPDTLKLKSFDVNLFKINLTDSPLIKDLKLHLKEAYEKIQEEQKAETPNNLFLEG